MRCIHIVNVYYNIVIYKVCICVCQLNSSTFVLHICTICIVFISWIVQTISVTELYLLFRQLLKSFKSYRKPFPLINMVYKSNQPNMLPENNCSRELYSYLMYLYESSHRLREKKNLDEKICSLEIRA